MIGIGVAIGIAVLAVISIFGIWSARYVKVGPEEALVISGRRRQLQGREIGFRILLNGGTFVWPVVEKVSRISLHALTVDVTTRNAISKEGVPLEVSGTAIFKVLGTDEGIASAAERFLGKPTEELITSVRSTLEGQLRAICGTLTPEEIYRDRTAFQAHIVEQAQGELQKIGIQLDILTLRDIRDEHGYLDALGKRRTAEVLRDARVGQAEANREATIREAEAKQASETRTAATQAQISEAEKERDVKRAKFTAETAAETARANLAGPRAKAEAEQEVVERQTVLAEKRAMQRQQELVAEKIKPAEAERDALVIKADGEAGSVRRKADARQFEIAKEGEGEAARTRSIGVAEADAVKAKLIAEADGLRAKADAMRQFDDAARTLEISKELIRVLPEIVRAAVDPVRSINRIDIVDFGGSASGANGGPINKILDISPASLAKADQTLKAVVGFGLADLAKRFGVTSSLAEIIDADVKDGKEPTKDVTR